MEFQLMHGEVQVADVIMDDDLGIITEVVDVMSPADLPVGTACGGTLDAGWLKAWWMRRSIPDGRDGIGGVLDALDAPTAYALAMRSKGLSLSDQYWIRESGSDDRWRDANLFDHPFSGTMGDLLLGSSAPEEGDPYDSPDGTTEGMLRKRWKIIDGERYLVKGGNPPSFQEPFNEVAASALMDALGIPHTEYKLVWIDDLPYSICRDFVTRDTDLVSAGRIASSQACPNHVSLYEHYLAMCNGFGIDARRETEMMLTVDYIMMNTDRHMNNFGLIRDASSLEYIGVAPIYDTGTSLWADTGKPEPGCKPFRRTFDEQIGLVSTLDWFDADAAYGALPEIREGLSERGFLGDGKVDAMMRTLERRIGRVESLKRDVQSIPIPRKRYM